MSRFWSRLVSQLDPYVPGEQPRVQNLIKLNTNEHPYGPSPRVIEAIAAANNDSLRLYPDPTAQALRESIAKNFNLQPEHVFVGNGSDEVLAHVFHALLKQDAPLVFPDISYSFYPVYCGLYEIAYKTIPLDEDLCIRLADYMPGGMSGLGQVGGIIFPNPNAPTGRGHPLEQIEAVVAANPDIVVVIDEAYVDFGAVSAAILINKYPNLLVVHTLSKSRSLAGLRVGYAMGHPDLIQGLDRVKNSFNSYPLDRLAQAGAIAAMQDVAYFDQTRQAVMLTREQLSQDLTALGFEVLPSQANFIFARHPDKSGEQLAADLRARHIIVRHFKAPVRISNFLRITIGTDEQCASLVRACREILASA
jgi:histidinol-phosphate aminotransferase